MDHEKNLHAKQASRSFFFLSFCDEETDGWDISISLLYFTSSVMGGMGWVLRSLAAGGNVSLCLLLPRREVGRIGDSEGFRVMFEMLNDGCC